MTIHNPKFEYAKIKRKDSPNGRRYITPDGQAVASVTTILGKTTPKEKIEGLNQWRKRIGEANAAEITKEAGSRGTSMHKQLENWLEHGELKTGGNLVHQQPAKMATVIVEKFFKPNLSEWWGSEVGLYYTGLYAGTTDLTALYNGVESVVDYKQTNKPKKREWIDDYFMQLAAYMCAHDHVYGTDLKQGVVLMCSKDLEPQEFILSGADLESYKAQWWNRVETFYKLS